MSEPTLSGAGTPGVCAFVLLSELPLLHGGLRARAETAALVR